VDPLGLRPDEDDFGIPPFSNGCGHLAKEDSASPGMYDLVGLFVDDGSCGYLAASGDTVGGANPAETAWCFGKSAHTVYRAPICAHVAGVLQREAQVVANNYWRDQRIPYEGTGRGGSPPDGSRGNAVLHMMYSGLIALHYGESIAEQLTNAHEIHETLDDAVTDQMNVQMDLSNNYYGRKLAAHAFNAFHLAERVRSFVDAGLACERRKGDGPSQHYTGGFVRSERCGLQ
jgi:hypothetical protein